MLLFPFAKINLGLAVIEKRLDGFHTIESLFQPIALYDILEIIENPDGKQDEFISSGFSLDCSLKENLVWQALLLLRETFDFPSVKIHLHKQIPAGSGLGGGSSDAAHTLLAINKLFKLDIKDANLFALASKLGSDCPFFLNKNTQYAKGKGEVLTPFKKNFKPMKLALIIPDLSISTPDAYAKIIAKSPIVLPKKALQKPIEEWKQFLKNDFEDLVFDSFPALKNVKELLYQKKAIYASLSGSGSALFGLFSEKTALNLPQEYQSYWLDF